MDWPERVIGVGEWVRLFRAAGFLSVGDTAWRVERGDLFVVPSWQALTVATDGGVDLFRFTDTPILEQLHQYRAQTGGAR